MKINSAMDKKGFGPKDMHFQLKINLGYAYQLYKLEKVPGRKLAEKINEWLKPFTTLDEIERPGNFK